MLAAVASIFITPWNLFNNPAVIHYTLDVLGSFIGPLYGVLIVDFYLVKRQKIVLDDLYTVDRRQILVSQWRELPRRDRAAAGRADRGALRDDAVARRDGKFFVVHRRGPRRAVLSRSRTLSTV